MLTTKQKSRTETQNIQKRKQKNTIENHQNKMAGRNTRKRNNGGTALVVQWVRLCTPNAGGLGSVPSGGTRSHMHTTAKKSACCNYEPTCRN